MRSRQSNIELLRIVLMLMIITHHSIFHGLGLRDISNSGFDKQQIKIQLLLNAIVIMAVNTFVFVSGYYGINLKLKTIASLLIQGAFYSIAIGYIFHLAYHDRFNVVYAMFPVSTNVWWFLTIYVALSFVAPLLNKGIQQINKNLFLIVLMALFYINCIAGFYFDMLSVNHGHSIFSFIFIYLLAAYIKRFEIILSFNTSIIGYSISVLLLFLASILCFKMNSFHLIPQVFAYNNPIVLIASVLLFFIFKSLRFENKMINAVSGLTLGIYLIHDHYYIRELIHQIMSTYLNKEGLQFLWILPIGIITIFILAGVIEYCRQLIFQPFIEYIFSRKLVVDFERRLSEELKY